MIGYPGTSGWRGPQPRPAMVLRNIPRAAEVFELFESTRIAASAR